MSIADKVKLIDDCISREVEWADESTDDIQDAWIDLKQVIKNQHTISIGIVDAIKEAKSYFTDEQELEVMQETNSDVNFEVGFYRGLLEAQSILRGKE